MQESTVQVGRWVGTTLYTALDTHSTSRGVVHVDGGTIILEGSEVSLGLVWNVVNVIGKVGRPAHVVYECFPGGSITKASG